MRIDRLLSSTLSPSSRLLVYRSDNVKKPKEDGVEVFDDYDTIT